MAFAPQTADTTAPSLHAFLVDYDGCAIDAQGTFNPRLKQHIIDTIKQALQEDPNAQFKLICFSGRQDYEIEAMGLRDLANGAAYNVLPELVKEINDELKQVLDCNNEVLIFDPVLMPDFIEESAPGTTHRSIANAMEGANRTQVCIGELPYVVQDTHKLTYTYGFSHYLAEHQGQVHVHAYDDRNVDILNLNYRYYENQRLNIPCNVHLNLHGMSIYDHIQYPDYPTLHGLGERDTNYARTLDRVYAANLFCIEKEFKYVEELAETYDFTQFREDNLSTKRVVFLNDEIHRETIRNERITQRLKDRNALKNISDSLYSLLLELWRSALRYFRMENYDECTVIAKLIETLINPSLLQENNAVIAAIDYAIQSLQQPPQALIRFKDEIFKLIEEASTEEVSPTEISTIEGLHVFLVDYDGCAVRSDGSFNQALISFICRTIQRNPNKVFKLACYSARQDYNIEKYNADEIGNGTAYSKLPELVRLVNMKLGHEALQFDPVLITDFYENVPPGTTHKAIADNFANPTSEAAQTFHHGSHYSNTFDSPKLSYTYGFAQYFANQNTRVHLDVFDDRDDIVKPNFHYFSQNPYTIPCNTSIRFYEAYAGKFHAEQPTLFRDRVHGLGNPDRSYSRTLRRLTAVNHYSLCEEEKGRLHDKAFIERAYDFTTLVEDDICGTRAAERMDVELLRQLVQEEQTEVHLGNIVLLKINEQQRQSLKDLWRLGQRCLRKRQTITGDIIIELVNDIVSTLIKAQQLNTPLYRELSKLIKQAEESHRDFATSSKGAYYHQAIKILHNELIGDRLSQKVVPLRCSARLKAQARKRAAPTATITAASLQPKKKRAKRT